MYTIKELARNALIHAREFLIEGNTRLETNCFDPLYKDYVAFRVTLMRVEKTKNNSFSLEPTNFIKNFEYEMSTAIRYGVGNCYELAQFALDYLHSIAPEINAEIYYIQEGDHAFLVINRDPISNLHDPMTWNFDVYICDPWANRFYPAYQYLNKLQNFYYTLGDESYCNHVEIFNLDKHLIAPLNQENSQTLSCAMSLENLRLILNEFQNLISELNEANIFLIIRFASIASRLKNKYGNADPKYQIIEHKLFLLHIIGNQIQSGMQMLVVFEQRLNEDSYNYRQIRQTLESTLEDSLLKFVAAISLNEEEQSILIAHRSHSFTNNFFGSRTLREFERAVNHCALDIKNILTSKKN